MPSTQPSAVTVIGGLAILAVCFASGRPAASSLTQSQIDRPALQRDLAAARARWTARKPSNYEFVLSIPADESYWSRRFASYRTTGGSSATLAPPTGMLAGVFRNRSTIDSLFELIAEQVASARREASVSYDDTLGYPTNASFDDYKDVSFELVTFRSFSRPSDVADPFALIQHVNHCGFMSSNRTDISSCPDYSIAMWGDGTVVYDGGAGVRILDRHQHQVGQTAVRDLTSAIGVAGFFSLADDYSSIRIGPDRLEMIDHAAEQWITIRLDGRQKTVHDFYGAPDALRRLEETIETLTDSRRYTGAKK